MRPLRGKQTGIIGVELEFPLVHTEGKSVDRTAALSLLDFFRGNGFAVLGRTCAGDAAFIRNDCGDVLSYDNSYNNFEFAMRYGDDLTVIERRFRRYFDLAARHLAPLGYALAGAGIHPHRERIAQNHVDYPVYNMLDEFLRRGNNPDFPAFLSSVQTHLDVTETDFPKAFTLFAKIAFARALLFSNSPADGLLCCRDGLWENSAFGGVGGITGKVDETFCNLSDVADSFLKRKIFNRIRNGKYEIIEPVSLTDYFSDPVYQAVPADIEQFLSFRDVELTYRGTLEIRGDCTQPIPDAFVPPAFHLGLAHRLDAAIRLTDEFFAQNDITESNTVLRNTAIKTGRLDGVDNGVLSEYLLSMVHLAEEGLSARGKGEERLLNDLQNRAKQGWCPAKGIMPNI
jgi:gamma-glutamylcysteine synthetase